MTSTSPAPRRRRFSLQAKLTLVFIGLLITPTLVSWWLVTQIGAVTSGFGRSEATARLTALEQRVTELERRERLSGEP